MTMDNMAVLAAVTVLAVVLQAYFSLQVIHGRRKYSVSPPCTEGPPQFQRLFRAQANCSEYFPMFITVLWTAGLFFSQGVASAFGLLYLYGRFRYFHGYSQCSQKRLAPLYFCASVLWALVCFSTLGILSTLCRLYLNLDISQMLN